jgi:succinate dehydrogenase / fumarate reductase cytochrome b subunit
VAAAVGSGAFAAVHDAYASRPGQAVLFAFTYVFFLHLCGGIRHLVWDTVHGFELASIYLTGWVVVVVSLAFTVAVWLAAELLKS